MLETEYVVDGPLSSQTEHVPDLPKFGRFRCTAELGSGGMGTVYRAHDDVLGRDVAIKTLRQVRGDDTILERFFREARTIGTIAHPNILAIYDVGTADGAPYLVMELAAAGSLRGRLAKGRLSADDVRALGIQIAQALAAAHAANVVHRDVKPANILASNDVWKLADFGIARVPGSTLTIEGQFLGSPWYAAPESLRAGVFAPASDIYGLGATLYEAATGTPPHGADDLGALMKRLDHDPPPPAGMPEPIAAAILAALARDPAARPSAERLAHMLAPAAPARPKPFPWRRAAFAIGGAALLLLVLALASRSPSPPAAAAAPPPAESAAPTDTPAAAAPIDAADDPPRDDETDDMPRDPYDEPHDPRPHGKGHGHGKHKHH